MTASEVGAAVELGGSAAAPPATIPDVGSTSTPQRWNELFKLAKLVSTTEIVPKPLRGRPDAIFAIMASAEERGIITAHRLAEHRSDRGPPRA